MFEGKTGNPTKVKDNTSFPSLRCLLQAALEVSCQDVYQKVEQPDPELFAPQDFPLEEAGFILNVLYGLGGHLPPSQQYSKGIEKEMICSGSTWAARDIGELPSRLHRFAVHHGLQGKCVMPGFLGVRFGSRIY